MVQVTFEACLLVFCEKCFAIQSLRIVRLGRMTREFAMFTIVSHRPEISTRKFDHDAC